MDKTPLYKYPAAYAREHGELEAYRASHKANVACRNAIEIAIREHYRDNRLHKEAVKQVVDEFGYDRTFYVLAASVREREWDGRFSPDNKRWAATIPVFQDLDAWKVDRNVEFVVNSHPGLTDIFIDTARHEYHLSLPLTREDIKAEAHKILSQFQDATEPNSPEGTHFMARVSPDFLLRAGSKDTGKLMGMLPFPSLSFSSVKGRTGVYALISKEENRFQPLRRGRASVRDKLQQTPSAPKPPASGRKKAQER